MKKRLLVAFVDALGPAQGRLLSERCPDLRQRRALDGVFGYSSGALASVLTGELPAAHGRMCLFTRAQDGASPLRSLRWLGLLPRLVHERARLRRLVGRLYAARAGWDGYFALHRVPPETFSWLDVPEREDLFQAAAIGSRPTFLAQARDAGLSVYAAPWQVPERERFAHAHEVLRRSPPDLTFLYATELDGHLHRHGTDAAVTRRALGRIGDHIDRARSLLSRDGADVTTLVVGDHGMADVHRVVDPRPILDRMPNLRAFVDSTMLRMWGSERDLERARPIVTGCIEGIRWLDRTELEALGTPVAGSPYGDAIGALPEGAIFAPSFVGGRVAGMHGYLPGGPSTQAALLSDRTIPDAVTAITHLAPVVRGELGLAA